MRCHRLVSRKCRIVSGLLSWPRTCPTTQDGTYHRGAHQAENCRQVALAVDAGIWRSMCALQMLHGSCRVSIHPDCRANSSNCHHIPLQQYAPAEDQFRLITWHLTLLWIKSLPVFIGWCQSNAKYLQRHLSNGRLDTADRAQYNMLSALRSLTYHLHTILKRLCSSSGFRMETSKSSKEQLRRGTEYAPHHSILSSTTTQ
jgi:hypothetical protein